MSTGSEDRVIRNDLISVVADSVGKRFLSGFGGQVDFIRGAAIGDDGLGKPIIALPSISKKGQSKIVPYINEVCINYVFLVSINNSLGMLFHTHPNCLYIQFCYSGCWCCNIAISCTLCCD